MRTRIRVGHWVEDFLRGLAPEPRRATWQAIKALAEDKGDRKQLDGKLAPYWRLRVGRVRVIYALKVVEGERDILCFFAGNRATVYAIIEQLLVSELIQELREA